MLRQQQLQLQLPAGCDNQQVLLLPLLLFCLM
jgi:hypothetical protein